MEGREQTGRVNHALAERINQYILEQKSSIAGNLQGDRLQPHIGQPVFEREI